MRHFALIGFLFVFVGLGYGQATRTWVSGVGDDVNPCSRTAPCKTFAGAISKTATNGEINCLDPGGYGAVTITKSITIDCSGTFGSILASGMPQGILVNISGNPSDPHKTVRLRGLSINGVGVNAGVGTNTGGNGIKIADAATVIVENVLIAGFSQSGILVANSGDVKVVVSGSSIRNNTGGGISGNPTGTADITVSNSLLTQNGTAITAGANSIFRLSGSTIAFNTAGLSAPAGKIFSFKNNTIDGNGTNGVPTSAAALQ
jgi:hypothetical protein